MAEQKTKSIIRKVISIILILLISFLGYKIYKKNNYYDYIKAEQNIGISKFERDNEEKYSDMDSYKIENQIYNDAMFYKKVNVRPNTPYKVSCMIKTKDVESKNINSDAGAHISINKSIEKSNNIEGTIEWTKVEFLFNSKNRTEIEIGFRLGGFEDNCKGTAWFSDFTIEAGVTDETNNWNFLCLIFNNIDVKIDANTSIKLNLNGTDKYDVNTCIRRFKDSMEEMSYNKIKINYDVYETNTPIKTMSYDKENGYYVSGNDIKNVLEPYVEQGKYDHIFVCFKTGNINVEKAELGNDWVGLGSMEYRGLGFSNIRLPDDNNNYIYKYDTSINTFPEEVFIHEFLHTLERNSEEYKYERPELHNSEKYGYKNERLIGLKAWYKDYMNKNIKTSSGNIGLLDEIYTKKPVKKSDFEYTHKLDYFNEPKNIIEELNNIFTKVINMFSNQ